MVRKKVLITGAGGLIGGILISRLKDYDLYLLDKKEIEAPRSFTVDILDLKKLQEVLQGMDVVVHLAADQDEEAPWESVLQNNIIGTYNVFEAARNGKVAKIVYASSNHVTGMYERDRKKPNEVINASSPIRPDGLYAVSKAFGEALGRLYADKYGISVICLRIGWVLPNGDPTREERLASIWLSHGDLVQLIEKSIETPIPYGIFYGVSNNKRRFWDVSDARRILGYQPKDDAEERRELRRC